MKWIATFKDLHLGVAFGKTLSEQHIPNQVEVLSDQAIVWIYHECHLEKAQFLLDQFPPPAPSPTTNPKKAIFENTPITLALTVLCLLFFLPPTLPMLLFNDPFPPTFQGFYTKIFQPQIFNPLSQAFYSITQGELWRLLTPALLHNDLFHLMFNLIWLIYLGRMIEHKTRHLLPLTITAAIFSNTAQYLISGPLFLGFSGVICAYLTFITHQQNYCPYPLPKQVSQFLLTFILALPLISLLLVLIKSPFQLPIANTAHLAGALYGFLYSYSLSCLGRVVK